MAISTVRVNISGVWTSLELNEETGKYEGVIVAPSITSYNLLGGYYPVTIEAANDAGTILTKDDTDLEIGNDLRLIVRERVKPVITLVYPSDGAYIQNANAPIVFRVKDEVNGSGVKEDGIIFSVDGEEATVTKEAVENGYECTYTPSEAMRDGEHTISIQAEDNDGNVADRVDVTYTIDTIPPTLTLSAPTFSITNQPECIVEGQTNDNLSTPVTVDVVLNDQDAQVIPVEEDGSFCMTLTLSEGDNEIKVISTDLSGRSTTIIKTVKLDTTIPRITNVVFEPNPTSTSQPVRIVLEVV